MLTGLSIGWLLAGTLAISLPIAAHLLTRASGPRRVLPTVRFLQQAVAEHAQRNRLRDVILLIVRCACILLLALMFDRPVWSAADHHATTDATIVVVDASASMQRVHQGRTLYDTAVQRATTLLDDLDSSHLAGAVFAGITPATALPRLSTNHDAVTQALQASAPTLEHADMTAALTAAATLPLPVAQRDQQIRRRIIAITDAQVSQWADITIPPGNAVEVIRVGPSDSTPNIAITSIRTQPSIPLVDTPMMLSVDVYSCDTVERSVEVVAQAGAHTVRTTAVVPAAGTTTIAIPFTLHAPGLIRCTASINDPAFPFDDAAHLVANVRSARAVTLLTNADVDDPDSAVFYVKRALQPGESGPWRTRGRTPGARMDGDIAIVVETDRLDATTLDDLAARVADGLGLLWVLDSPGSTAAATALLDRLDTPQTITPHTDATVGVRVGDGRTAAPEALTSPDALGATRPTARLVDQGNVLLRFENGDPALVLHRADRGTVALLAASLDPSASSLHRAPLFPVLLRFVLQSLLPSEHTSLTGHVGEPLRAAPTSNAQLPRDADGRPAQPLDDDTLRVLPVDTPGFLEVLDRDGSVIAIAAANIDPRESDMRILPTDAIARLLQNDQPEAPTLAAASTDHQLWPWILLGVLVLLGLEQVVSTEVRRA
jgi:hypothetical protein